MQDLLLLIHRIPYPPNKGDKIRSYHLLKHLARHYRVHLATFVDDADDWQYVPHVEALCASSHFAAMQPLVARVKSLTALLKNGSLSLAYYRDAGLARWVQDTVAANRIERVLVFSSAMAQYADPYRGARRVVDFVDVDSDKWRQYADKKSFPMSWLYRYEADRLLRYERQVARDYDASLFVSAPEAQLFRSLAPESSAKIGHFSNGVDTDYFSPHEAHANPFGAGERALVFTGAMDYWPNVDAVQWFAGAVFPALRQRFTDLRFYIVGSRPSPAVQALAQQPGVVVTGTVPDVRPYIAHAAVAVAPLRIARGIQNKVLEAMAMATPVVVTPQALEGIDAVPDSELVLAADDAAAFADAVAALLDGHADAAAAIGRAARAKVQSRYSWSSNLACIGENLECS
ncbi:TIGR03087 family PEP-CTERM/XrtA system glycosyltransferase [Massilia forsythiae]|uniref:TIGR03087 family PEP-CTERM/XrtA system glycosyltransferase n=1 Tax=Massilia forsythiae TaxID=2728020 RepID=A0A7Z2VUV5_9BURK|nr:TIGR03087 family PEP-CTERM/XrtA system glycosyltransferase [Massilia forsythiae]QJD99887.1 TIGR03087 family PEP-CTERM/XrtA system glycosyltransferase [Massilia forsythiae]